MRRPARQPEQPQIADSPEQAAYVRPARAADGTSVAAAERGLLVSVIAREARHRLTHHPAVRLLRLAIRTRVRLAAQIVAEGRPNRDVTIGDVSKFGALIMGVDDFVRDQPVALVMRDGTRIEARVRWTRATRAGVEFVEPVADIARLIEMSEAEPQEPATGSAPEASMAGATAGARPISRPSRMLERACRKQGFYWLAEIGSDADDAHPAGRDMAADAEGRSRAPSRRSR